jgi:ribonucleoside-diphosphate reductase alpha chain
MIEIHPEIKVRKRDGREVSFDPDRIAGAISKAFRADLELKADQPLAPDVQAEIRELTRTVVAQILEKRTGDGTLPFGVEQIQDWVEIQMMSRGRYTVARRYIVYREAHKRARVLRGEDPEASRHTRFRVHYPDGSQRPVDPRKIQDRLRDAFRSIDQEPPAELLDEIYGSLYDGIRPAEIEKAMILASRSRIEQDPIYSKLAARLLLNTVYREVFGTIPAADTLEDVYQNRFARYLEKGIQADRLSPGLLHFDLNRIVRALCVQRDHDLGYLGLQTICDRYLIRVEDRWIETPQYFWMRVAMGLALAEKTQREERAIEFYNTLSTFRFVSSTPTLFNAGTLHPQLSSCYLSTVRDDLGHIFKVVSDNAQLSKWAGGLGNDWTGIRATGAYIKGTNGASQGVIPFLKVANDTAVAVNQGGKRKGALCSYLETWHLDIEDFLDLRKNTGDERRRTHDMHTANWIPDLFMRRVIEEGKWTLFSPNEVPDLHDLYGKAFEERYVQYERMADDGKIRRFRRVEAVQLWRKMLSMLFETGHPWITFKDPSNIRSPQDHVGVIHSSNLCTEILLNTSPEETAVCNLGSVNLAAHLKEEGLDEAALAQTVRAAVRMLDNVIDINYYPTPEARNANLRHRPVGLGIMGFQDALYQQRIPYAGEAAVEFADRSMEVTSFHAILASAELARERGTYPSYRGSKWDRGLLPIDTLDLLERERDGLLDVDRSSTMNWEIARKAVAECGMRNSNVMAIAPTATISNIVGVSQSIEPSYRNLYVKSNLSGEFTVINPYLVADLQERGLWDDRMIDDLKYYDGSIQQIERIPQDLKELYRTAFEIEPEWLIECASRRQKWIDMGQSLNLYLDKPLGRLLHEMYLSAWRKGLKTTYYLRSLGATQIEKASVDINRRGIQPRWMKSVSASSRVQILREEAPGGESEAAEAVPAPACSLDDPTCEACQ